MLCVDFGKIDWHRFWVSLNVCVHAGSDLGCNELGHCTGQYVLGVQIEIQ